MTMLPSPDLLDLAEAVAAGALREDDAERQLRLVLGSVRAAQSEQAVRELRRLIGAAGAVRAHARATREAFGSASPDLAPTVASTPASITTLVPGRITAAAVHRRSSSDGDGTGRAPRRTWLLAAAALLLVGGAMAATGSGLVRLPSLVPPVPAPTLPVALTNPTAEPSPSPRVALSPAPTEAPAVVPPRAASWTTTGSMITSRSGHTATLLPDGRVLVAGGYSFTGDAGATLASAEVYDPGAGSWTVTGTMITPRFGHAATLLPDGNVLVVGGFGLDGDLASAELYDPNTGTWTAAGTMGLPRNHPTAVALPDGKVLVAGGVELASSELYDPVTGVWTSTGTMSTPRYGQAATLLRDGKVLVAGGATSPVGSPSYLLGSAELYDPATGAWTATGTMVSIYSQSPATLLPDGRVLMGGFPPELYDPGTGSWTAAEGPVISGWHGPAALLTDGRVLVMGAAIPGQDVASEMAAAVFDPVTGSWSPAGRTDTPRVARIGTYTATLLLDGKLLVAGGEDASSTASVTPTLADTELYDPGNR
jgi:galactose oxidase-like protein